MANKDADMSATTKTGWNSRLLVVVVCAATMTMKSLGAQPTVTNVIAQQRTSSSMVDISYDVFDISGHVQTVTMAISTNSGAQYLPLTPTAEGAIGAGVITGAQKQIVWHADVDLPDFSGSTVRVKITADDAFSSNLYLVVDVSAGPTAVSYPVTYLTSQPTLDDTYKSTRILLRKIPAGSFTMGSPTNELGRDTAEGPQHMVTLSVDFYMAVFEITQGQYSNVMGSTPSRFPQGALGSYRPVEQVSWNTVRGGTWPGGTPAAGTFMDVLRTKTGLAFDLPTEAQWEYACPAGTTNALNNNTNLTNIYSDGNMDLLGRYYCNGGSTVWDDPINGAHAAAGSYAANNWGLFDMHGNVWEWCLDCYGGYGGSVTNPPGPASGPYRVIRGGSWISNASVCRSAYRIHGTPDGFDYNIGFRPVLTTGQ